MVVPNSNTHAPDPNPQICATRDQLAACKDQADGATCTIQALVGYCLDGVCLPIQCGNGRVDPGEACDPPRTTANDRCSDDCKSTQVCGNGIVDPATNEECDDGNLLDHDNCDSTCHVESPLWTQVAIDQITARSNASMAFDVAHGVAVLFGGYDPTATCLGDTWFWNGAGWAQASPLFAPRGRAGAAVAYDSHRQRLVLFGGTCGLTFGDTWEWDGTSWHAITTPVAPSPRSGAAMAYDEHRQRIVLYGGDPGVTGDAFRGINPLGDTWEWDGSTWVETSNSSTVIDARAYAAIAYDPKRGRVVLFGGEVAGLVALANADVYEYDGTAWSDHPVAGPSSRTSATMAWEPVTGAVMMFGGTDTNTPNNETWLWNGTTWSAATTLPVPAARAYHMMTTDPFRKRVIVFGGGGDDPPTTWEWDGNNWANLTPTSPVALTTVDEIAFDSERHRAVIYDPADNVTWETDGASWTSSTSVPTPNRSSPGVAYDEARGKTVLFGGDVQNSTDAGDTWLWDGNTWTQVTPATSPSGRTAPLAYDAARKQVVMFGGTPDLTPNSGNVVPLDETWLWDGATWTQAFPAHKPPARFTHTLANDPVRNEVVLFGGDNGTGTIFGDTWVWDGTDWTQRQPMHAPTAQTSAHAAWNANRKKLALLDGVTNTVWEWDGKNKDWSPVTSPSPPPLREDGLLFASGDQSGVVLFGGFAPVPPPSAPIIYTDSWLLRWQGPSPSEACRLDIDVDADGTKGCADPDCWSSCTPSCPPGTSCDPSEPHCGDGTCNAALETCRNCPSDCGACTAICGDTFCDAPETSATCPGDCP
jgi:cysteine-rich repeat protein